MRPFCVECYSNDHWTEDCPLNPVLAALDILQDAVINYTNSKPTRPVYEFEVFYGGTPGRPLYDQGVCPGEADQRNVVKAANHMDAICKSAANSEHSGSKTRFVVVGRSPARAAFEQKVFPNLYNEHDAALRTAVVFDIAPVRPGEDYDFIANPRGGRYKVTVVA